MTDPTQDIPNFVEAERAAIGAVLLQPDSYELADLRSDQFYDPRHQIVWGAIGRVRLRGEPIDDVTLSAEIKSEGKLDAIGGVAFLGEIVVDTPLAGHLEHYARQVRDYDLRRRVMLAASSIVTNCRKRDQSGIDLHADALSKMAGIDIRSDRKVSTVGELIGKRYLEIIDLAERRASGKKAVGGIPTGVDQLDELLSGIQRGIATPVGGRPGMGKSAFAMSCARAAVAAEIGVIDYSIEDTEAARMDRLLSQASGVPAQDLRAGRVDRGDLVNLSRALEEWRHTTLWRFDGRGDLDADDIVRDTRKRARDIPNLQLVIVDLVNELRWPRRARDMKEAMSINFRRLATLAREDNLAVLVLCHLNRTLEDRKDKRPRQRDFKETGAMEERGKCMISLYRGSEYGPPTEGVDYEKGEQPPTDEEWAQRIEIGVIKNSNGQTGIVRAKWHGPTTRVYS